MSNKVFSHLKSKDENNVVNKKSFGLIPRMTINDNKAGMQGLDKEKINRVIMENTVGSKFYKNEQRREAQVKDRIEKMNKRLQSFSVQEKKMAIQKADQIIVEVENERNLTRTILHIDMDAFYASVEERDRPDLKTKPMAVGGMDMLSTSNYIARKFGVRAAMPGFIALKLCPKLEIVPLNFTKYKEVSNEIQKIYAQYDENFMPCSLDEAYLDITDYLEKRIAIPEDERTFEVESELMSTSDKVPCRNVILKTFGFSAEEVAAEIRFRILQKTKLTASAGIAPNLMLAKIASDLNKPNGQALITFSRDGIIAFMNSLPIRKVNGIGRVNEQLLTSLNIETCGDLIQERATLVLLFSPSSTAFFLRVGLGCSSNHVTQEGERKSISTERTFNATSDMNKLVMKLEELCQALSSDMQAHGIQGKTVTLKTKTVDFELHTRSKSCSRLLSSAEEIFLVAKELLKQETEQTSGTPSYRLLGIGLSKFDMLSSGKQTSIKKFFSKFTPKPEISCNSRLGKNGAANFDSKEPGSLIATAANSSKDDTAITPQISCPVCSSTNFEDLAHLNHHLDQCLSRDFTGKAVEDEPRGPDELHFSEFTCPVCSIALDTADSFLLNSHVDECLNRQAIKHILKSEAPSKSSYSMSPNSSKRQKTAIKKTNTITKFFS